MWSRGRVYHSPVSELPHSRKATQRISIRAKPSRPGKITATLPGIRLSSTPHDFSDLPSYKMSKKAAVPDAWDDDWEAQADKADAAPEIAKAKEIVRVTKAERLAKHAETNRKIWESA